VREEETDLSFAEFGGSERLYPAPEESERRKLARREGFEPPTLRFEEESEPEEDPVDALS
jgi:hypothetical protein